MFKALQNHKNLSGVYEYRDPRFETKAIDLAAHNGYQQRHIDHDAEIENYIDTRPELTPETFESYLHWRYAQPDLKVKFPDGFRRR